MKQIKLSDLKVGDKLPDTPNHGFGYYNNRSVNTIEYTAKGRLVITLNETYVNNNGDSVVKSGSPYSNGALSPNTNITILS